MIPAGEVLERAAFHGAPGDAVPVLGGLDPDGELPARTRWLVGVCLGALGRYRSAERWLAPGCTTSPIDPFALTCLASHLRQQGRHAAAEPLDATALAAATDPEARADALVGLVADAVGRLDLGTAERRLAAARAELVPAGRASVGGDGAWRSAVRLAWVTAEVALLGDCPDGAVIAAEDAWARSRAASAPRHSVKSDLVLGASLEAAGRTRAATRILRAAAAGADRLDLVQLAWPARTLLSRTLAQRAPITAAAERRRADSRQSIIEEGSDSCMTR